MGSDNGSVPMDNTMPTNHNNIAFTFGALILSIVFLLGVPGNLFIIWSVLARARKRSVTTLLILNLACADGFLMCLTIFFIIYLAKHNWIFGGAMCKVLFYLCNTNMYASIMIITLMSLHRVVAVVWPAHLPACTRKRRVSCLLVGMWIVVFLLALPAVIFRAEKEKNVNGKRHILCAVHHNRSEHVVFQYTLETTVGFLVPYAIIVGSYVCILRRLRQTRFRKMIRSENLIHAIIITFCIFWLPYHVNNVLLVVGALTPDASPLKQRLESIGQSSRAATSALAFISSCANPVLYTFAGRSYIKADGLAFMARLFESTVLNNGVRTLESSNAPNLLGLERRQSTT
ncbi:leukotriene B4 receptor 2b [Triplophysa dalaica]|uniref:leukotriene B4 receptor 2b n=1 Tax=Triplophysa dalaica TaxID=1582913 RepID=UPI0024DFCAAC|nr:leukotriene B4 receptor 2b [Triplophysa dalaica]XP_056599916.1 leukotriene B4 receptor 2b [Triplophysa dalaica]XP_056599917.1 leukotriene B4 receptor 2b [Triplophysa dalaica]